MNILLPKGPSYHSMSSVRPFAPEVSMDNVHVIDLPAASSVPAKAMKRGSPDPGDCEIPALIASLRPPSSVLLPSAVPVEDAGHTNANNDWKPTRGFMNGILLALPLWGLIGFVTWFVLAW